MRLAYVRRPLKAKKTTGASLGSLQESDLRSKDCNGQFSLTHCVKCGCIRSRHLRRSCRISPAAVRQQEPDQIGTGTEAKATGQGRLGLSMLA